MLSCCDVQAILAVGAGSMAVNAVKGVLGGGDKADEEVSKHAKKASSGGDDGISKALDSLRKSGKASAICMLDHYREAQRA